MSDTPQEPVIQAPDDRAKAALRDEAGRFAKAMEFPEGWEERIKALAGDDDDDVQEDQGERTAPETEASEEPEAETAEPTKDDEEKPDKSESKEPDRKRTKALKDARTQLVSFGFNEEDLAGLSEEAVLRMGAKALKRNSDFNKTRQSSPNDPGKAEPAAKSEPTAKTVEPTEDAFKRASQRFREKYADSEGFGQDIEDFGREIVEPLNSALAEANERAARAEAAAQEVAFESAKSALRERFPQVDTEEGEAALLERMKLQAEAARLSGNEYTSLKKLATDAAMVEFGQGAIEAAEKSAAEAKARRAKNSGNPSTGRDVKPAAAKAFDLDAAALAAARGAEGSIVRKAFNAPR